MKSLLLPFLNHNVYHGFEKLHAHIVMQVLDPNSFDDPKEFQPRIKKTKNTPRNKSYKVKNELIVQVDLSDCLKWEVLGDAAVVQFLQEKS